jgi:hypothetical protein
MNQKIKDMKKSIVTIGILVISFLSFGQGEIGEIIGKIYEDEKGSNPAFGATVWVEYAGSKIRARVDENGRFRITAVPTGKHQLQAVYLGDTLDQDILLDVYADGSANIGKIYFHEKLVTTAEHKVVRKTRNPLIDFGDVGVRRISTEDVARSPVRNNAKQLIVSFNSEIKMDQNGELMIRGSRAGDLVYFLDGVKLQDVKSIPSAAIGGVSVYSSAIPAKYGDTAGGVIIMETKSYHDIQRERKARMVKVERSLEPVETENLETENDVEQVD